MPSRQTSYMLQVKSLTRKESAGWMYIDQEKPELFTGKFYPAIPNRDINTLSLEVFGSSFQPLKIAGY